VATTGKKPKTEWQLSRRNVAPYCGTDGGGALWKNSKGSKAGVRRVRLSKAGIEGHSIGKKKLKT